MHYGCLAINKPKAPLDSGLSPPYPPYWCFSMPYNRTIIDDFLDGLANFARDFAQDRIEQALPKPPRAPQTRRVPGKAPKAKTSKAERKNTSKRRAMDQEAHDRRAGITLYDDLEVSAHASQETIRAAWVSLSKRFHPDVSKAKDAAERIKRINSAWDTLGDPVKRRAYDQWRKNEGQ